MRLLGSACPCAGMTSSANLDNLLAGASLSSVLPHRMVLLARTSLPLIAASLLSRAPSPALTTPQCPIHALSTMSAPSPSSPEFLQDKLSTLLASPHIHFNAPPAGGPLHIRMGHGPVDLFSTRFLNFFTADARGVVGGKEVDHDGLKDALLALQKKWNPQEARFEAQSEAAKVRLRAHICGS